MEAHAIRGAILARDKKFQKVIIETDSLMLSKLLNNEHAMLPHMSVLTITERRRDANIPASSIQKYLVQKLSLPSESEVEINCCGKPVDPTQPLRNLVELWLKGRSTQATQATVGSPAEDFVMVLTYGRPKAMAS